MNVYVVWSQPHDSKGDVYMGDHNIIGVYISELIAYKTACVKQVYEHMEHDDFKEEMEDWLYENPFPDAEEDDVNVWQNYFKVVCNDNFINDKLKKEYSHWNSNWYKPLYIQYHVTKMELQIEE